MADEFKEGTLCASIPTSAISTSHICVSVYSTTCLICGESVDITEYEAFSGRALARVCDKCKEAVLEMRRQLDANKRDV